jgi:hypothetical protein
MTSSYWKVIVNFNLTTYEDAIAVLRSELAEVEDAGLTLQIEELHRLQKVIDSLDDKLTNVKQFLPKPERKRGLINMGGSLLKVLFGTATVADLAGLHTTVDKLSQNQEAVVHAVNDQVTYIEQLDSNVKFNHQAVTNMAAILRDYVVKIRDKYQNTVSRIEWLRRQQEATVAVHYANPISASAGAAFGSLSDLNDGKNSR